MIVTKVQVISCNEQQKKLALEIPCLAINEKNLGEKNLVRVVFIVTVNLFLSKEYSFNKK